MFCYRELVGNVDDVDNMTGLTMLTMLTMLTLFNPSLFGPFNTQHISLIVPSNVTIWGDDSVDLRFIVLHGELRSQQGALDDFGH